VAFLLAKSLVSAHTVGGAASIFATQTSSDSLGPE
jgi:hypothetical protein